MTVQEDVPEVCDLLGQHDALVNSVDLENSLIDLLKDRKNFVALLEQLNGISKKISVLVESHILNPRVTRDFINSIENDLNNQAARETSVAFSTILRSRGNHHSEWFDRSEHLTSSLLDSGLHYFVFHPALIDVAKEKWGANRRVHVEGMPPPEGYDVARVQLLEAHGIPGDSSTWFWAYEALTIARERLDEIGIGFQLSDYVEWTCSDEPPNVSSDAVVSEVRFVRTAGFGERLSEECGSERLDGCKIWKASGGKLVSPLWEYLSWGAPRFDDREDDARNLGHIGEGLDAAVASLDPESDPLDVSLVRLAATHIYRAGEAAVKLRVAKELGEAALKGFRAQAVESVRARKSGAHSRNTRIRRREDLLSHIERLIEQNPVLAHVSEPEVAKIAVENAKNSDPELWVQGVGQVGEYLGEIRRGEAGPELHQRYLALFLNSRRR